MLARLIIIVFLTFFAVGLFESIVPLWSEARFGWGPRDIGLCFMYLGLVIAFSQGYLAGKLATAFRRTEAGHVRHGHLRRRADLDDAVA